MAEVDGARVSRGTAIVASGPQVRKPDGQPEWVGRHLPTVDWVIGAEMLITVRQFREVGGCLTRSRRQPQLVASHM